MSSATTNDAPLLLTSRRASLDSWNPFLSYISWYSKYDEGFRSDGKKYANMVFGNPQDRPIPEFVAALRRQLDGADLPTASPSTFAYKPRFPESADAVVDVLQRTRGIKMDPDDVTLTNGALGALSLCFFVLADPLDEAILITPSYFFYRPMMEYAGLKPVAVAANPEKGFDLDIDAIHKAITPATRVICLNSPNNPTGKIYPRATLEKLSNMLQRVNNERADAAGGAGFQPIMVISDEAYCRILFDDKDSYQTIAQVYPFSVMVYTWGKTLLAPSERFGYIATSPVMPESGRLLLRDKIFRSQLLGWTIPNATTAQAYAEIEAANLVIDIDQLKVRRDRMYNSLTEQGWNAIKPGGSFYMLVQVPQDMFASEDDLVNALAEEERVLVLHGSIMEIPGWIRLSLTASDEMVDFSIAAFARIRDKRSSLGLQEG
jgi:aspartate aminotransferase